MKKSLGKGLAAVTAAFAVFTMGFFLGRNQPHEIPKISVSPTAAQTLPAAEETPDSPYVTFPIDLNRATRADLTELPGIGTVIADRIIDYRESTGGFSSPEELLNVEGIGSKRLEGILDLVTTGG